MGNTLSNNRTIFWVPLLFPLLYLIGSAFHFFRVVFGLLKKVGVIKGEGLDASESLSSTRVFCKDNDITCLNMESST